MSLYETVMGVLNDATPAKAQRGEDPSKDGPEAPAEKDPAEAPPKDKGKAPAQQVQTAAPSKTMLDGLVVRMTEFSKDLEALVAEVHPSAKVVVDSLETKSGVTLRFALELNPDERQALVAAWKGRV